ncbi:MFS transporter [Kineosporia succinea]|uniref:EmrB/QacA subfamily drug resistance transporter n=1 Tax=Kineosporia succinea TaxID=84632 RepID=A0ABT9NXY8_9ACTN|nr:MFS transporter [Kineosporia succinea]MDP9825308.1 EmrB/QacA subfamily drug resistance transporter [Kineosporia succinea]
MTSHDTMPQTRHDNRWPAFAVCLVAGFMTLLDVSIVNVALPSIRSGVSATSSELQWVSSGYALSFGLVLVAAGRMGDVRGRKNVFIAGLTLFTLASALCGLAPNAALLVVARVLQGVAGGLLQPQISGFIQELFQGKERARAFGLFGATVGISTAVGPLVGGALIAAFGTDHGWRAVFFVNVPVGIAAVIAAFRLLPASTTRRESKGLDPVGAVLLGAGVLCLLLPLVESRSWTGVLPWLLMIPAVLLLTGFVLWERRAADPMVDLNLLRIPSYSLGSVVGLVYFAGFTAIFFVFALFLQEGKGYSALESGLALTPFAIGSSVAAFVGGRLIGRLGLRLVAIGLAMVITGLLATVVAVRLVDGDGIGLWTALPLLIAGLGSGAVISPNLTLTLGDVPVAQAGTAGGIVQTAQRIGAAAGIAAVGALFFARLDGTRGDWNASLSDALLLCAAVTFLALVVAVTDLRRRAHRTAASTVGSAQT